MIDEKCNTGKLKKETADAIAEMIEAVGEEVRRELIEERRAGQQDAEGLAIVPIEQIRDMG